MTVEEFFGASNDKNSEIFSKIEAFRSEYGLEYLHLIQISIYGFAWSYRGGDFDSGKLMRDLIALATEHTGVIYNPDLENFLLLDDCVEEVEILIDQLVRPYVESHEGVIELVSVNEKTGEVIVSMRGTCGGCASLPLTLKGGVEGILKNRLPWVRSVELSESKPEPKTADQIQNPAEKPSDDIVITESAASKIKELIDELKLADTAGMRIKVVPGGCSGFKYGITIEDKPDPDDSVSSMKFYKDGKQEAGRVFVDRKSLQLLKGSILDYTKTPDGLGETFKIKNPNAKSSCGCGESDSL